MEIGEKGYILQNGIITKVTILNKKYFEDELLYQYIGINQNSWCTIYPTLLDLIKSISTKEVRDELSSL